MKYKPPEQEQLRARVANEIGIRVAETVIGNGWISRRKFLEVGSRVIAVTVIAAVSSQDTLKAEQNPVRAIRSNRTDQIPGIQ